MHASLSGIALIFCALMLAACATTPISHDGAVAIARKTVAARENWPKGVSPGPTFIEVLSCTPARNSDGTWTVKVSQGILDVNSGHTSTLSGSRRVVRLSSTGKVLGYAAAK